MTDLPDCRIAPFEERFRRDVIELWGACGLIRPWNDPDKDVDRKLSDRNGGFFVVLAPSHEGGDEVLIASVMAGYDGHRGSIYYLAVAPEHQSSGVGRFLMEYCEAFLVELGCPKIHLMVRQENDKVLSFYERLGYAPETSATLGKRLIPDI
ncbi:GNAT family acetyltransferase [Roseibium sp.]|uniref:GNAT family acetyltransferase n=1 Tax=Roseibium sp. TaxID=1936156 RepID=UPI003A975DED